MTTWLKCEHCKEMFEISNEIADAMTRWRNASGEPFTCRECAGVDEIYENDPVGASCARDAILTSKKGNHGILRKLGQKRL